MAKENALAQLRDIHLPAPINWWPLAPGWYVLAIGLLLLVWGLVYLDHKRRKQAKPKKQALELLAVYQQQYEKDHNTQIASARISELLRRVALVYYPRSEVASLHGEDWIYFLNNTGKSMDFKAVQSMLLELPFKISEPVDIKPLFKTVELWIKQRRVPCSN